MVSTVAIGLSATGVNPVSVNNTVSLSLGNVTLGTGTLSLSVAGNITQQLGTTIQTGGSLTTTTGTNNRDVILGNAGNRIAGVVTAIESTPNFLRDYSLRNSFDNATLPTGIPFTTAGDIRNLTLYFDNNGIALPGYNISNNLTITAGGAITQSAGLTVPGSASFTILGDFGTTLTDAANAFSGTALFIAAQSTQPIQIVNAGNLTLGASDLGRGSFSATTTAGIITSTAGLLQHKGSPGATFTAAGGTISLTGQNDFTGPTTFAGAGLTTVATRNVDPQAQVNDIVIPASVTNLTITFDSAGAVLPAYNLSTLTVTALGIAQGTGTGVKVSGQTTLSAGAYSILLPNPANDFNNVTLANAGRNDVTIADVNAIGFNGTSTLGTGRLTVTAGGAITEPGGGAITQSATGPVGDVKVASTGGAITLNGNNQFVGAFSASVTGANNAAVTNSGTLLTLGTIGTGTGSFTATDGAEGIVQAPISALALERAIDVHFGRLSDVDGPIEQFCRGRGTECCRRIGALVRRHHPGRVQCHRHADGQDGRRSRSIGHAIGRDHRQHGGVVRCRRRRCNAEQRREQFQQCIDRLDGRRLVDYRLGRGRFEHRQARVRHAERRRGREHHGVRGPAPLSKRGPGLLR